MEHPMSQLNDLSRSLTSLEQDSTIIAVIEMSQSSWLVAGIVPGIERHPLKKLEPSEEDLIRLLMRWRAEATEHGRTITRIAVAFEAGRDGFWLARWLRSTAALITTCRTSYAGLRPISAGTTSIIFVAQSHTTGRPTCCADTP